MASSGAAYYGLFFVGHWMTARSLLRRLVAAGAASLVAMILIVIGIEAWARSTWDPKKGRPGFFLSDPGRVERLAPNYDGWFAGVPAKLDKATPVVSAPVLSNTRT